MWPTCRRESKTRTHNGSARSTSIACTLVTKNWQIARASEWPFQEPWIFPELLLVVMRKACSRLAASWKSSRDCPQPNALWSSSSNNLKQVLKTPRLYLRRKQPNDHPGNLQEPRMPTRNSRPSGRSDPRFSARPICWARVNITVCNCLPSMTTCLKSTR